MPNPETSSPSLEKEIEKINQEAAAEADYKERTERVLEGIAANDKELDKFVREKSEGLEPYAKEMIDLYVPLAQAYEKTYPVVKTPDKEGLRSAVRTLADIVDQSGEKLEKLFAYEKYGFYKDRFENLKDDVEAILLDAEMVEEKKKNIFAKDQKKILAQKISLKYQTLRDLVRDIFQASLTQKGDPEYYHLPDEIDNYIWGKDAEKMSEK